MKEEIRMRRLCLSPYENSISLWRIQAKESDYPQYHSVPGPQPLPPPSIPPSAYEYRGVLVQVVENLDGIRGALRLPALRREVEPQAVDEFQGTPFPPEAPPKRESEMQTIEGSYELGHWGSDTVPAFTRKSRAPVE